jgi:hypothetical protein
MVFGTRFRSVDNRIEAMGTQIDHLQLQLSSQINQARRELALLVLRTVLVSTTVVAGMCLLTIIVVL